MKKINIKNSALFALLLVKNLLFAQKITSQVINTSGGTQQISGYSLTYSIGQTATTTLKSNNYIITQGFQQAEKNTSVSVKEDSEKMSFRATLFPNPTQDILNLNIESDENETFQIVLFTISGQQVLQSTFLGNTYQIEVSQLPAGAYFLKLQNTKNQKAMTAKFVKM